MEKINCPLTMALPPSPGLDLGRTAYSNTRFGAHEFSVLYKITSRSKNGYMADALAVAFSTRKEYEQFLSETGLENEPGGPDVYIAEEDALSVISDRDMPAGISQGRQGKAPGKKETATCYVSGSQRMEDGRYMIFLDTMDLEFKRRALIIALAEPEADFIFE